MRKALPLLVALLPGCFSPENRTTNPFSPSFGDVPVSPEAKLIQVGFTAPSPSCRNLGPVFGATYAGATWQPADLHAERALHDALNKAAGLGSNYLLAQAPQMKGMNGGGIVGATIMGVAYRCPPETPEAQAYAAGYAQLQAQRDAEKRAHDEAEAKVRAQAEHVRAAARARADAEKASEAAKAQTAPTPGTPSELAARNADRAKQIDADPPNPPVKLDRVAVDDVQVMREFPERECTPLGDEQVVAPERSVVRGITLLRKNATDRHANLVVLDPIDDHAKETVIFGRYYACKP
jgi:hypothetical protein